MTADPSNWGLPILVPTLPFQRPGIQWWLVLNVDLSSQEKSAQGTGLRVSLQSVEDEPPLPLKRWSWSSSRSRRNPRTDHTHARGRRALRLCEARRTQVGQHGQRATAGGRVLKGPGEPRVWFNDCHFPSLFSFWSFSVSESCLLRYQGERSLNQKLTFFPLSLGHTGLGTFNISKHYACGEKNLGLTNTDLFLANNLCFTYYQQKKLSKRGSPSPEGFA